MRATEVLQKCLGESLHAIHASRSKVLMRAVEAAIAGRRLTFKTERGHAKGVRFINLRERGQVH